MTEKLSRSGSRRLIISGASSRGLTTGVHETAKRVRRAAEPSSREQGVVGVRGGGARASGAKVCPSSARAHEQGEVARAEGAIARGHVARGHVARGRVAGGRGAEGAIAEGSGAEGLVSESLVGEGSGRDAAAGDGATAGAQAQAPLVGHVPCALVVDDDPEIRRALARLLRPELDVHVAGSVAQAEATLARLDRVDVAFVDWELPDGTGEQILERLARWPDAIRVLISARVSSSENPLRNRALANLVLGKPLAIGVVDALKRAALALPHG